MGLPKKSLRKALLCAGIPRLGLEPSESQLVLGWGLGMWYCFRTKEKRKGKSKNVVGGVNGKPKGKPRSAQSLFLSFFNFGGVPLKIDTSAWVCCCSFCFSRKGKQQLNFVAD